MYTMIVAYRGQSLTGNENDLDDSGGIRASPVWLPWRKWLGPHNFEHEVRHRLAPAGESNV